MNEKKKIFEQHIIYSRRMNKFLPVQGSIYFFFFDIH